MNAYFAKAVIKGRWQRKTSQAFDWFCTYFTQNYIKEIYDLISNVIIYSTKVSVRDLIVLSGTLLHYDRRNFSEMT